MPARSASGGGRRLDFRFFLDCHGHRTGPHGQPTLHFALDIMGKLSGSGLGEVHAVSGTQSSGLTLNVRARLSEAAVLVDEAIPHIDIDDARLIGPAAIEVVEKRDVAGRFLPAQWWQPYPEHRYPRRLRLPCRRLDPGVPRRAWRASRSRWRWPTLCAWPAD